MTTTFSAFYSNLKSSLGVQVRKLLENFVKDLIRTRIFQIKERSEQSLLIQELMDSMEAVYNKTFPPKDDLEGILSGEGVENCVCKNLYSEIFSPPDSSDE